MRRFDTGKLVAAVGAVVLLVSLFLHWYRPGLTAWTAFEVWDLVLAALALTTLVAAAAELGWWRGPVPAGRLPMIAAAAVGIVVVALLNHPPAAVGADLDSGAWVALAGVLLMAAGGLLGEARISLTLRVDRAPHAPHAAAPAATPKDQAPTRVATVAAPVPTHTGTPLSPPVGLTPRDPG